MKYTTFYRGINWDCLASLKKNVMKCTHDVAGRRPATSWVYYTTSCNTQSSVPEDGQNNCPKNVELTGIINKPLFLHLVGCLYYLYKGEKKGKSVPLQAWNGPEGSRELRFPNFMTTALGGGKVLSFTHRPHLPPGDSPGTHFC